MNRAICQPGVPPTVTVWTVAGTAVVPGSPLPGGGTSVAKAAGAAMIAPSTAVRAAARRTAGRKMRWIVVMTVSLMVVRSQD